MEGLSPEADISSKSYLHVCILKFSKIYFAVDLHHPRRGF